MLLVSACGDEGLLSNVGDKSRDFVYSGTSTTTTLEVLSGTTMPLGVVSAADVEWLNDSFPDPNGAEPNVVINRVWQRGDRSSSFIQASRAEIATVLPELKFPSLISDQAGWVTSQLVFDLASGTLDNGTSAAFGLWQVEPYTVTEGRLAVLRVGVVREPEDAGRTPIEADVVEEGLSLAWVDGLLRYELFCRASILDEMCWQMAENVSPLRRLLHGATS